MKTLRILLSSFAIFALSSCHHGTASLTAARDQRGPVPTAGPVPQTAPPKAGLRSPLNYLDTNSIDIATVIPAPPVAGSADDQSDLSEVLQLQTLRTKADCDRANYEVKISLEDFFGPKYGSLTEAEVTSLNSVFNKIYIDAGYFVLAAKNRWTRPRPFINHPNVTPCLPLETTTSYPSGHSTLAHVYALVLSDLDPKDQAIFMARADEVARDRVIGGVHYPSDVAEGTNFAIIIHDALLKSPAFNSDIDTLKSAF